MSMSAMIAGILVGFSKAGLKGINVITVTLLALTFGAKASTGIVLLLLIMGDTMAVLYYKRKCNWSLLFKLLPYVVIGVCVGAFLGQDMPEVIFKKVMSIIIIFSAIMMIISEKYSYEVTDKSTLLSIILGLLTGITTMIGNLAGAFSNLFFLSMRLSKEAFIGTAAWLFFIINIFKIPFHVFMWETVHTNSLLTAIKILPFIALGFVIGLKTVALFSDKNYRYFIIVMTIVGAVVMLFKE